MADEFERLIEYNVASTYGLDPASSEDTLRKAGKVAVAAALVATLGAGPVDMQEYELPQPAPIVYVLDPPPSDEPVATVDDDQENKQSLLQRVLKILKYGLIVVLMVGVCLFGAVKGCTAITGAVPPAATVESDNDER